MSNLRVLYVTSEISPFLEISKAADFIRQLPQGLQEKGTEIRILMPRFGCINERKNRLHEVVRLSGINITVGEEEKPLTIKVASIPNARLQVYFLDNEDYFQRKFALVDEKNKFYTDNDERAIFLCKGALETVKKLGWSPDIIHCQDWMTGLIPLYLKTTYKNDPIFKNSKCIFAVFNSDGNQEFSADLQQKIKMRDINDDMLKNFESGDFNGFVKIGMEYADAISYDQVMGKGLKDLFSDFSHKMSLGPVEEDEMIDSYYNFYNELMES